VRAQLDVEHRAMQNEVEGRKTHSSRATLLAPNLDKSKNKNVIKIRMDRITG